MHHIPLEGCPNLWDIGGCSTAEGRQVRTSRVYRSGRLSDLTERDLERLSSLGLATVVDFRSEDEIAEHPDRLPDHAACRRVHIPMGEGMLSKEQVIDVMRRASRGELDTHVHMIQEYREFPRRLAPGLRTLCRLLEQEETYPVLMHCTAGKDRTGFTTAVLLGMVGCSDQQIIAGYTRYIRSSLREDALRYASSYRTYGIELSPEQVHPYLLAREEYIRSALESIRSLWENISGYLDQEVNVAPRQQQGIAEQLLTR